jgi:DnaK suppressor protein
VRCTQCLLDSVIGDGRFGCHSAARRARFSFAARTWPFRGCKIFPSCPEFPYRVPRNRKWTENLDRYKRVLLERRGEMSIASAEAESPIPAERAPAGRSRRPSNANNEAELQIHFHQTNLRLLRAIEDALARIRHGTFSTCEACQNPISRARLEAVPWARLCRDCKERQHR